MLKLILKPIRRARAFVRWARRNPRMKAAKQAARNDHLLQLSLVTQPLWITPANYRELRPLRQWGYIATCLVLAGFAWANATVQLAGEMIPLIATSLTEIGSVLGVRVVVQHFGADTLALWLVRGVTVGLIIVSALFSYTEHLVAGFLTRLLRAPPPLKLGPGYFFLTRAGDIAGLFAIFGGIVWLADSKNRFMLDWLNEQPVLANIILPLLLAGFGLGGMVWCLANEERNRQIYGTVWRMAAYRSGATAILLGAPMVLLAIAY